MTYPSKKSITVMLNLFQHLTNETLKQVWGGKIFFSLLFLASIACDASAEITFLRMRYLYSMDAVGSGIPLSIAAKIFIDNKNKELYAVDEGNDRIVVMGLDGLFVIDFSSTNANITGPPRDIVVADDGKIYMALEEKIIVLNYNGRYLRDLDIKGLAGEKVIFTGIEILGNDLFIGETVKKRVLVVDSRTGEIKNDFREGIPPNIRLAVDLDGGFYILDSAAYTVYRFDKDGKPISSFGRLSGLAGGFSAPIGISIDRVNGRVIVVDANRVAIVIFDRDGNYIFEFGGPELFYWITLAEPDNSGRIYTSDATGKIRVFELLKETIEDEVPAKAAPPEEVPALPESEDVQTIEAPPAEVKPAAEPIPQSPTGAEDKAKKDEN